MARREKLTYRNDSAPDLEATDLLHMEHEEGYGGYGYLGHPIRRPGFWVSRSKSPYIMPHLIDQEVVDAANILDWTYEQLFFWANSRAGRHLADEIIGMDERLRGMAIERSLGLIAEEEDFPRGGAR